MRKMLVGAVSVLSLVSLQFATKNVQAASLSRDVSMLQGPPVKEVTLPYEAALKCLAGVLTPAQKSVVFTVDSFPDSTGKINMVADNGTGQFNSQAGQQMMLTALAQTGVTVANTNPAFMARMNYALEKEGMLNAALVHEGKSPVFDENILIPDVSIGGSISTLDVVPGTEGEGSVQGIGGGARQYRILISMDGEATRVPGTPANNPVIPGRGGQVLAVVPLQKQVVGYEVKAGVNTLFGPLNSVFGVQFDFDHQKNEALELTGRVMMQLLAYKLVSDTLHVHSCDDQVAYVDALMSGGPFPKPASNSATLQFAPPPDPKQATEVPH